MNLASNNDVQRLRDEVGALSARLARQEKALAALEQTLATVAASLDRLQSTAAPAGTQEA
jgi:uncharacterized coiled-coil protein SlyX